MLRPRIIDVLSKSCSGSCVQAVHGAISRQSSDIGTGLLFASRAGARKESGSVSRRHYAVMPTWSNCFSTRLSFEPSSTLRAPKKSRRPGNRSVAGRIDDQTARRGRCLGQTTAGDSLGGADCGYRAGQSPDQRVICRIHCGRQGLRLGCPRRSNFRSGQPAGNPAAFQSALSPFDRYLYKSRNLIERFLSRIKQFRRIATRYDKLAKSFLSFVHLVRQTSFDGRSVPVNAGGTDQPEASAGEASGFDRRVNFRNALVGVLSVEDGTPGDAAALGGRSALMRNSSGSGWKTPIGKCSVARPTFNTNRRSTHRQEWPRVVGQNFGFYK